MRTKKHIRFVLFYALWIAGIIWALGSCSGTKKAVSDETIKELKQQADSRSIKVRAEWAIPLTTTAMASVYNSGLLPPGSNVSRINLMQTPNSFEIRGDTIYADLPYYGERRIVSGYPGVSGIDFKAPMENYKSEFLDKEGSYRINFDASFGTERFDIMVKLFPGQKAVLMFYSTQRNPIRYEGVAENPQSE
ncbi:DUF4251 domain-containing protein [Lentiprolixibacter aurantiacus]|uniref:DUF4251 domain-containing protein n=1 Tax=Lentiprolixibacter aurantiacus TaxID=2993939 RepID=A0AAE3MMK2_9FLAO|nr:DUF4251 domain-containing protein [Lentiprolixibacter aurantiacus]MCX2719634.1 DUF4251 domain-containing protein [Lentiprolixibacter aurantiacus]